LGWIDVGGNVSGFDYNIGDTRGYSCPGGVCLDTSLPGGTNDVLGVNGNANGGVQQIIWRRKIDTGDSNDVVIAGTNTLIYSWSGINKGPTIQRHVRNPTPIALNFFTGGTTKLADLKLIHGSLMFIAWFGIAPFGFFLARFMKSFSWWFQVHRAIMLVAMATMIAAFGVIIAETAPGEHFNNAHKIIGLIVVIMGAAQPVIGFLADKLFNPDRKSTPVFPDMVHWSLGWVSITLGMINIILGLILYEKTDRGVLIAYCVGAAAVFVFCVGFAIFRLIKPAQAAHP